MEFYKEELNKLANLGLYRSLSKITSPQEAEVEVDNRKMLLFASNNYLGLANHPKLKAGAIRAINTWGAGSGASRLVTGNTALHEELETKLAAFKGHEGAILFNTGYMANVGVISSLMGSEDIIFSDELNHASIIDGIRLSKAKVVVYKHNDISDLETKLKLVNQGNTIGKKLIVTDGVFSMDGDIALLKELVDLKNRYGGLLMVDDAHGTGVLGEHGRGTAEYYGVSKEVDINLGTLSKALGGEGGYVTGSKELIEYLHNKARTFIFSTAQMPAAIGAGIAALEVIQEEKWRITQLRDNAAYLRKNIEKLGFNVPEGSTPIIPVIIGSNHDTLNFSKGLNEEGLLVPAIRPPTVPEGTGRLRITVMATHTKEHLDQAIALFSKIGRETGVI
jgi:8-amino-7-oxononanoate synthase